MNRKHFFFALLLLCCAGCDHSPPDSMGDIRACACDTSADSAIYSDVQGALLGSRFTSLEELKSVIQIKYFNNNAPTDSTVHRFSKVCLTDCSNGKQVISILESGVSQGDFAKASDGGFWDQLHLLINSPYAVAHRGELGKAYLLARSRTDLFGEGDPAFFDLAKAATKNINTPDLAFMDARDSTEKGYINSFNHITASALITSCFSRQLADFIGDAHERYFHPELITGKFPEREIKDLDEGPVDNYVDLINNEWGMKLGEVLKEKYHINQATNWTPELLADYLNDLQSYYSWAFQIGFKPVSPQDEIVIRFSNKLNLVMSGAVSLGKA